MVIIFINSRKEEFLYKRNVLFQFFGLTGSNWTLKRLKMFIAKCIKCQFKAV